MPDKLRHGALSRAPSAGLEIYVDDEFRAGGEPAAGEGDMEARPSSGAPGWAHLGTFEQTRKENVQQPAAWAGPRPALHAYARLTCCLHL